MSSCKESNSETGGSAYAAARAIVSRIRKRDSMHEVRGGIVVPGGVGASCARRGGGVKRLAIAFLIALAALAAFAAFEVVPRSEADADANGRAIPTLEAASPSTGTIVVTWENPSETATLASYRISWGLWENGLTSYRDANSETGGNAYPTAPASSYTITGLAPGEYKVGVRARYGDNRNGAFKESGKVTVAAPSPEPTPTPLPSPTPEPSPEPTPEPAQRGEAKDDSSKTRTDLPGNEAEE